MASIIMKKMKGLGKTMMLMMMIQDLIPGDLFRNTTRKRRSLEDFSRWVKFSSFSNHTKANNL